jgi:spore germination cell wall hydrolase CwlJ-like protein
MIDFIKALFITVLNFFSPAEDIAIVEAAPEAVITLPVQELVFDEEQLACAALNIYYEARNQSELGQIAVSQVVFNRAKEDFWPNNICDVVKQGSYTTGRVSRHQCQFSWYCDGLSDRPKEFSTWQNALEVARYSYFAWTYGYDITEGSTNYHSSKVNPKWRNDRGMKYVKTVHDHHFYHWDTDTSVASDTESLYNDSVALKGT